MFGATHRWLTPLVAMVALTWAELGSARSGAPPLELAWVGPPECPDGRTVADDAVRLASADDKPLPSVRAKVSIQRAEDSNYVLTLTTETGGSGSVQTFRAASCPAVAQAAAVTLALLLNPAGASHSLPPARGPSAIPLGSSRRQPLPLRAAAFGLVGAQFGLLPRVSPTFGAELGVRLGRASAWLGGAYGPPQRTLLKGESLGGELSLVHAMLYGCGAIVSASPSLNLCAGMDFNRVSGRGVGVADERVGAIYWFSALGGAATELAVHPNIAVRFGAFAGAPLDHPAAFVEGAGDVHRPAAVVANLHAGLGVIWP